MEIFEGSLQDPKEIATLRYREHRILRWVTPREECHDATFRTFIHYGNNFWHEMLLYWCKLSWVQTFAGINFRD